MTTEGLLVREKLPSQSANGFWTKLKRSMLKDTDETVIQRRDPLQRSVSASIKVTDRDTSSREDHNDQLKIPHRAALRSSSDQLLSSMRRTQLELAYKDHENNVLNAKPVPELRTRSVSDRLGSLAVPTSKSSKPSSIRSDKHSISGSDHSASSRRSNSSKPDSASRIPQPIDSRDAKTLWSKIRHQCVERVPAAAPRQRSQCMGTLWELLFEAIKAGDLLNSYEPDPKVWWRKVFLNLKHRHGKAKASSIANQLMQNPEMLSAIQTKLAGMVADHHAFMQSLPKSVRRRLKALKKLQSEILTLEAQFYKEVHLLECKYAQKYTPLFEKRCHIISGEVEPTEEECEWPSDEEDDPDLSEQTANLKLKEQGEEADDNVKGIRGFWLTTLKNVDLLASMIQEHDEPILEHLTDISVSFSPDPMGFTLEFHFSPNPYFTDPVLTKSYEMRSEPDEHDPFTFEGPEIVACQGCTITWNKGKNVTVKTVKKKQKHQKKGTTRMVTKEVQNDSFFNFFSPPEPSDPSAGEEIDEETEALLQADYEIGHFIREHIVPKAVLYFTGEANDDEDFEDDDEGDDEDVSDEDDGDYDPAVAQHVENKDCKQQ